MSKDLAQTYYALAAAGWLYLPTYVFVAARTGNLAFALEDGEKRKPDEW